MNRPRLCPKCRTLVGVDESSCYKCGASLGAAGRFVHGTVRNSVELGREVAWWQIILGANIALFVVGLGLTGLREGSGAVLGSGILSIRPSGDILLRMGMQTDALVGGGQWWRLITSTFLHGGLLHIGFNMYFLAQLGPAAEKIFGQRGFLVIYVLGGVVGGFVQLAIGGAVVGASGSLMALIGALAGYGRLQFGVWRNPLSRDMFRTLIFITLIGLLPGLHAAHGSHIGGFVGGVGVLFLVHGLIQRRRLKALTWLARASVALVVIAMSSMVMAAQMPYPNDIMALDRCMNNAHQAGKRAIIEEQPASPPACLQQGYGFGDEGAAYREEMQVMLEDLVPGPGGVAKAQRLQALMVRYKAWLDGYVRLYGMRWSQ